MGQIRVKSLDLGDADLTSAAGRMVTHILNVVAQFERDLIRERTQAGCRPRPRARQAARPAAGSRPGTARGDRGRAEEG
ncbi:recombinase family protein [uncultured Jannaschia sp.]